MTRQAYGTTVFCDDIRHEISGKLTLVGCYLSEMGFTESAPGTLPVFCALVNVWVPLTREFSSVTVAVTKELEGGEKEKMFEATADVSREDREKAINDTADGELEDRFAVLTFPLRWSNVEFQRSGYVKVRAYLDGSDEVKAGALKVVFPASPEVA